jgi:hypothetical protein
MAMETNLNWAKLVERGECRAVGIPWNDEEREAVFVKKIPAEYVRIGVLNKEDLAIRLEEEKESKDVPLIKQDKEALLMMAHKIGIPATSAADKATLINEIEAKNSAKENLQAKKEDKEKKLKKPKK